MLKIVNPFHISYSSPFTSPSNGCTIHNMTEAVFYIGKTHVDNGIEHHIKEQLCRDLNFREWRNTVPSRTPSKLSKYKNGYFTIYDSQQEILNHGIELPIGQQLVHGGLWWTRENICILDRPLSSTFNPQIALAEAGRHPICFDNGRIDLFLMTIISHGIKAFPYSITRGKLAYEYEVLIQAGAKLILKKEYCVSENYALGKIIPYLPSLIRNDGKIFVLEVDIVFDNSIFRNYEGRFI